MGDCGCGGGKKRYEVPTDGGPPQDTARGPGNDNYTWPPKRGNGPSEKKES